MGETGPHYFFLVDPAFFVVFFGLGCFIPQDMLSPPSLLLYLSLLI